MQVSLGHLIALSFSIEKIFLIKSYFHWNFDPNSWNPNQSSQGIRLNRVRILSKSLNSIDFNQKEIESDWKSEIISTFSMKFNFFDLFIDQNWSQIIHFIRYLVSQFLHCLVFKTVLHLYIFASWLNLQW